MQPFPAAVLVFSRVSDTWQNIVRQVCPQALLMMCNNSYFREFTLKNISLFYTLSKRRLQTEAVLVRGYFLMMSSLS